MELNTVMDLAKRCEAIHSDMGPVPKKKNGQPMTRWYSRVYSHLAGKRAIVWVVGKPCSTIRFDAEEFVQRWLDEHPEIESVPATNPTLAPRPRVAEVEEPRLRELADDELVYANTPKCYRCGVKDPLIVSRVPESDSEAFDFVFRQFCGLRSPRVIMLSGFDQSARALVMAQSERLLKEKGVLIMESEPVGGTRMTIYAIALDYYHASALVGGFARDNQIKAVGERIAAGVERLCDAWEKPPVELVEV